MKKSELASFIKEEILSALGEDKQTQQDIKDTEELTKATAELAKAKEEAGITENAGLINQIFEIIEVNGLDAMDVMEAIGQQFGVNFEFGRLEEAEDKEPSKSDLKATKGLAKAKEELAQLTKQMKSLARKYKEAEGEEKEKLVADLKKKTKLKKELEAIVNK